MCYNCARSGTQAQGTAATQENLFSVMVEAQMGHGITVETSVYITSDNISFVTVSRITDSLSAIGKLRG